MAEAPKTLSKSALAALVLIAVVGGYGLLLLLYLWTDIFTPEFFIKLSISWGVIVTMLVVIYLIYAEMISDKRKRDNGFLD